MYIALLTQSKLFSRKYVEGGDLGWLIIYHLSCITEQQTDSFMEHILYEFHVNLL